MSIIYSPNPLYQKGAFIVLRQSRALFMPRPARNLTQRFALPRPFGVPSALLAVGFVKQGSCCCPAHYSQVLNQSRPSPSGAGAALTGLRARLCGRFNQQPPKGFIMSNTIQTVERYRIVIEEDLLALVKQAIELEQRYKQAKDYSDKKQELEDQLYDLYSDIGWAVVYDIKELPF